MPPKITQFWFVTTLWGMVDGWHDEKYVKIFLGALLVDPPMDRLPLHWKIIPEMAQCDPPLLHPLTQPSSKQKLCYSLWRYLGQNSRMRKCSSKNLSFLEDEVGIRDQELPCAKQHKNTAKQQEEASLSRPISKWCTKTWITMDTIPSIYSMKASSHWVPSILSIKLKQVFLH